MQTRALVRARAPRIGTVLVLAVTLSGTAACSPSAPGPTSSPTPAPSGTAQSEEPSTSQPSPGRETVEVSSGDVTVEVVAPDGGRPASVADDDGGRAVSVDLATPGAVATLSLTSSGSFEVNADDSITVLGDDGTAVGGLLAPEVATYDDGPPAASSGVTVEQVDDRHVEIGVEGDGPASVTTVLGTDALRSVDWGEREGGRSLAVDPTAWARSAGRAGQDVVWAQLVAVEPEADSPTMRDQLTCHALGAPDKATWNLEPWRPDVGLVAVLAARCNPT